MRDLPTGIDVLRRALGTPPVLADGTDARRAAVAAILSAGADGPNLWFIQRAEHPKDPWSGHVALPGGRVEVTDRDARATAVRETLEEIGVDLTNADAIGALDDLGPQAGLPRLVVHPHVFWMPEMPEMRLNAVEVAGVFCAPLSFLLAGHGRSRFELDWKGNNWVLPQVELPGPHGTDVKLWGMTLRIVDDLLHRIDGLGIGLERLAGAGVTGTAAIGSSS